MKARGWPQSLGLAGAVDMGIGVREVEGIGEKEAEGTGERVA